MNVENNHKDIINNLPRLRWSCRRGMLELDVLLGNFLENGYLKLDDDHKNLFVRLLEAPDPELLVWLMGNGKPADQDLCKIVEIIKNDPKC